MVVFVVESIALICVLLIAGLVPDDNRTAFRRLSKWFASLATNRQACIVLFGVISFAFAAAMSLVVHRPVPADHEEFAYLLGAEIFGLGRLTNPSHKNWEHFETFDVIQDPTYQMRLPPGQSLWLAAGDLLWEPILGVWLSLGLGIAAVTWMLFVWLPSRWALLSSIMLLANFRILRYSSQHFIGGADTMLGGALLFASLPLLRTRPGLGPALAFGVGGGLLLLSQPQLGVLAILCALGVLLAWRIVDGNWRPDLKTFTLGLMAALPLLLSVVWLGYYNFRVTGDLWTSPSKVYFQQYGSLTPLEMASLPAEEELDAPRRIPQPVLDEETAEEIQEDAQMNSKPLVKLVVIGAFYLGVVLVVPLVMAFRSIWKSQILAATIVSVVLFTALLIWPSASQPRHLMPVICLLFYLVGEGMRRLWHWRVRTTPLGPVLICGLPLIVLMIHSLLIYDYFQQPVVRDLQWSTDRAQIIQDLHTNEKRDLVFVRYAADHNIKHEWVHNAADIDSAEIIWARELSAEQNKRLMESFPDREVWLLEVEANSQRRLAVDRNAPLEAPPASETQ